MCAGLSLRETTFLNMCIIENYLFHLRTSVSLGMCRTTTRTCIVPGSGRLQVSDVAGFGRT